MQQITIENARVRVVMLAEYGARVVHLIDKVTGRDWMAPGGVSANVGENAVYGIDEAVGWDECFPTVGAWNAQHTGWRRELRDHGDLWGLPWQVDAASAEVVSTTYAGREFVFRRVLSLEDAVLIADYEVTNTGQAPLPYLWALHGLFDVAQGDRLILEGTAHVEAAYLGIAGRHYPPASLPWPGPSDAFPIPLDEVHPPTSGIAAKLYAHGIPSRSVAVGQSGEWLVIGWDETINDLGIWMTYGGWPAPGGVQQLAPEPTSASADDLGDAIAKGTAVDLAPGQTRRWTVRLSVGNGVSPQTDAVGTAPRRQ